jgi:hypothetical protein
MENIAAVSKVAVAVVTKGVKNISNSFKKISPSIKDLFAKFFSLIANFFSKTPKIIKVQYNMVGLQNYLSSTYQYAKSPHLFIEYPNKEPQFYEEDIKQLEEKAIKKIVGEEEFNRVQFEIKQSKDNGIENTANYKVNQKQKDDLLKNLVKIMLKLIDESIQDSYTLSLSKDYNQKLKDFIERRYTNKLRTENG